VVRLVLNQHSAQIRRSAITYNCFSTNSPVTSIADLHNLARRPAAACRPPPQGKCSDRNDLEHCPKKYNKTLFAYLVAEAVRFACQVIQEQVASRKPD